MSFFWESYYEGVFNVLEFIFKERVYERCARRNLRTEREVGFGNKVNSFTLTLTLTLNIQQVLFISALYSLRFL
jgi:hypothetical protein